MERNYKLCREWGGRDGYRRYEGDFKSVESARKGARERYRYLSKHAPNLKVRYSVLKMPEGRVEAIFEWGPKNVPNGQA